MTHIAKSMRGKNVLTFCGKYIDRQLPLPRRRRGDWGDSSYSGPPRPRAYIFPEAAKESIRSYSTICKKCLDEDRTLIRSLVRQNALTLRNSKEIHISNKSLNEIVDTLCGKLLTIEEIFGSDIGWVPIAHMTRHIKNPLLCRTCVNTPEANMQLLRETSL